MSKPTSPALIGSFVIGAVALLVAAVMLFGGSEFLKEKRRYVTYFDQSVKGLRVGADVLFRGVRIGYVTDIRIVGDIDSLNFFIPVEFQVLPEQINLRRDGEKVAYKFPVDQHDLKRLIDAGLRAQLNTESFVTGQLVVELDIFPDSKAEFRGAQPPHPEIPSIPSGIQQALADVQRFIREIQTTADIPQLIRHVEGILSGLDTIANAPELPRAIAGIDRLVNSSEARALGPELREAIGDFQGAVTDARRLFNNADTQLQSLSSNVKPTLANLDNAVERALDLLERVSKQLGSESETNYELVNTLTEIQGAARSMRILLDYLERHPEALIRGKKPMDDKPE